MNRIGVSKESLAPGDVPRPQDEQQTNIRFLKKVGLKQNIKNKYILSK